MLCVRIYRIIWWLVIPFALLRLVWRSFFRRDYLTGWQQRCGFALAGYQPADIWMHAVSLGESRVAIQLLTSIGYMHAQNGSNTKPLGILLTATTQAGMRVLKRFADAEKHAGALSIQTRYMSFDCKWIQQRVLSHIRPKLLVSIETEIWPNLFSACYAKGITCMVANARLSARSAHRQRRLIHLFKPSLASIHLLAQDKATMLRYRALSKTATITISGNCKVDQAITAARAALPTKTLVDKNSYTLVFGSIRNDESKLLFQAAKKLLADGPRYRIIWVPRHPEAMQKSLIRWLADAGINWAILHPQDNTENTNAAAAQATFVLDTRYGHLIDVYAAANLVIMGGTFGTGGSQNVLEPCALGKAVVCGPSRRNFALIHSKLHTRGAASYLAKTENLAENLYDRVQQLFHSTHDTKVMGEKAQQVVAEMQGATKTQAEYIYREWSAKKTAAS